MKVPDKCLDCNHTIMQLEEVNDGFCKSHIDCVVRCDCFPVHYIVGCSCAEIYCEKRIKEWKQRMAESEGRNESVEV